MNDGDKITVNNYNEILDVYGLTQHISYPTRQGKSLNNHISTNIPKKVICENVTPCETNNKRPWCTVCGFKYKKAEVLT